MLAVGWSYRSTGSIGRSCSIQSVLLTHASCRLQAASLRRSSNLPTWEYGSPPLSTISIARLQERKKFSRSEIRTVQIRQTWNWQGMPQKLQISFRRALPTIMAKLKKKRAPPYARSSPVKSLNDAAVAHHAVRSSSPAKERRQSIKLSS